MLFYELMDSVSHAFRYKATLCPMPLDTKQIGFLSMILLTSIFLIFMLWTKETMPGLVIDGFLNGGLALYDVSRAFY